MALSLTEDEFLHRHYETKAEFTYELGRRVGPRTPALAKANIEVSPDSLLSVQIDLGEFFVWLADSVVEAAAATVYEEEQP